MGLMDIWREHRAQRDFDRRVAPSWFTDMYNHALFNARREGVSHHLDQDILRTMAAAVRHMSPGEQRHLHRAVIGLLLGHLIWVWENTRDNPNARDAAPANIPGLHQWRLDLLNRLATSPVLSAQDVVHATNDFVALLGGFDLASLPQTRDAVELVLCLGHAPVSPLPLVFAWGVSAHAGRYVVPTKLPVMDRDGAVFFSHQVAHVADALLSLLDGGQNQHEGRLSFLHQWRFRFDHTLADRAAPRQGVPGEPPLDWVTPLCAQADALARPLGVQLHGTAGLPGLWGQLTPRGQWLVFQDFALWCFVPQLQTFLDWHSHGRSIPFPFLPDDFLSSGLYLTGDDVHAAVSLLNARLPTEFDAAQRALARDAAKALVLTGQRDGDFCTPFVRLCLELWGHNRLFEPHVSFEVRRRALDHALAGGAAGDSPYPWAHPHLQHMAVNVTQQLLGGLKDLIDEQIAHEKTDDAAGPPAMAA